MLGKHEVFRKKNFIPTFENMWSHECLPLISCIWQSWMSLSCGQWGQSVGVRDAATIRDHPSMSGLYPMVASRRAVVGGSWLPRICPWWVLRRMARAISIQVKKKDLFRIFFLSKKTQKSIFFCRLKCQTLLIRSWAARFQLCIHCYKIVLWLW